MLHSRSSQFVGLLLLVLVSGVSFLAGVRLSDDGLQRINGTLAFVSPNAHEACVLQDGKRERSCTAMALPRDAQLPAIGSRVEAGLVAIPERQVGGTNDARLLVYVYLVPR